MAIGRDGAALTRLLGVGLCAQRTFKSGASSVDVSLGVIKSLECFVMQTDSLSFEK